MKMLIQRVNKASVTVDEQITGSIDKGFLVFLGVGRDDTKEQADKLVKKMTGLRIFADDEDKINLSLNDIGGEVLIVSQFTLYADCKKGFRPSFVNAGSPDVAEELYEYVIAETKKVIPKVEKGIFGADMQVSLVNDGPFTVMLEA